MIRFWIYLKLESTEFSDKLVMEHKRKIRIRDNSKVSGLSNWKVLLQLTKMLWGQVGRDFGFEYTISEMPVRYPRRVK